jgi:hypothetical protein
MSLAGLELSGRHGDAQGFARLPGGLMSLNEAD